VGWASNRFSAALALCTRLPRAEKVRVRVRVSVRVRVRVRVSVRVRVRIRVRVRVRVRVRGRVKVRVRANPNPNPNQEAHEKAWPSLITLNAKDRAKLHPQSAFPYPQAG